MRQLPVMSPQAFLGYEFWPAAAGRALALSASSLHTPKARKHLRCSRPCRDGPTTALLRRRQGFFMCRLWFSRAAAVLNSGWVCLPANPGDQPPRREVFGQLLQMAENHPAPEQLRERHTGQRHRPPRHRRAHHQVSSPPLSHGRWTGWVPAAAAATFGPRAV